ncbi:hypothetical protein JTB14_024000 [Gonioctena quinquepunctata]|nr:hypothetical protein JTB14_024000 [Gonioctena quinquepunctata]
MGQLPEMEITPGLRRFINTGMDYFGPFHVTVGRRRKKCWGILFACLAIRTIHLGVAHHSTTNSTGMRIGRLISKRRHPNNDNEELLKNYAKLTNTLMRSGLLMNPHHISGSYLQQLG